jgi:hypothetical protein
MTVYFLSVWERLSEAGVCMPDDGIRRCAHRAWVDAGRPDDVEAFIRWWAGLSPEWW